MCAIIGFNWDDKQLAKKMADSLSHRGPDDFGVYTDNHMSFAHRRLAIIDLSKDGHQPMSYLHLTITFNGEIFNYIELKKDLEAKGHRFVSKSDTEVILHAYAQWGEQCLQKFNGQFAFCIYDSKKKTLFLARDRLGITPVYYLHENNKFLFASEIKAFRQYKQLEFSKEYVQHYLTYGYVYQFVNPYKNVSKLPQAHYIIFDLKTKKLSLKKYWSLDFNKKFPLSFNQAKQEIRKRFEESVKLRLRSDVPVGVYLSGGVDSSAVAAFAAKNLPKVNTFSFGSQEGDQNDIKYAKMLSERHDTNHKVFYSSDFDTLKELQGLYKYYDVPLADTASLALFMLTKQVKRKASVVLTGDGGDELFGGYTRYTWFRRLLAARPILRAAKPLAPFTKNDKVKNVLLAPKNPAALYSRIALPVGYGFLKRTGLSLSPKDIKFIQFKKTFTAKANIDSAFNADIAFYLEHLLLKTDTCTMASAVEPRVPLLDHNIAQLSAGLPSKFKCDFKSTKRILRDTFLPELGKEIAYRKKSGFGIATHLKRDDLIPIIEENASLLREFKAHPTKSALENVTYKDAYRLANLALFLKSQ